jgi:hypothetical protein
LTCTFGEALVAVEALTDMREVLERPDIMSRKQVMM